MKCVNCGGTARFVEEHGYFECNYCGAHQRPARSQDEVQILGEPLGKDCPRCNAPLVTAKVGRWGLVACDRCEGLLIEQPDFPHIVRWERAHYGGPPLEVTLDPSDASRAKLVCPLCQKEMERSRHFGPGNIFMDSCLGCARIWLDAGELRRITRSAGTF